MSTFGAVNVNHRRHIGLQQVEAFAASVHAFLGPNKNYKFVQDDAAGDSSLVCSGFRLLEHLQVSCSVGQLLSETVQAQQKSLHSGSTSLIFLAGAWSRAALECLHKGIPISHILSAMSEGLQVCIGTCRQRAVPLKEFLSMAGAEKKCPRECLDSNGKGTQCFGTCLPAQQKQNTALLKPVANLSESSCRGEGGLASHSYRDKSVLKNRVKLKHSRYFSLTDEVETECTASVQSYSHTQHSQNYSDMGHIARAVSHGYMGSMNLVLEANRMQSRGGSEKGSYGAFDVEKLVTCVLPGMTEDLSCVLSGLVVLLCEEQASLLKQMKDRKLRIALVNGDLSEKYRHLGFNKAANVTFVKDLSNLSGISREDEWMDIVLATLQALRVDLLLVSGVITKKLGDHLLGRNVLAIERVSRAVLKDFAVTTAAVPVTYVTQLSERCIGSGVGIERWRECSNNGKTDSVAVSISSEGTSLVTAVICSTIPGKLQTLEDQFWGCAHRLCHAIQDGALLHGAGATELLCIRQLRKHMASSEHAEMGIRQSGRVRAVGPYEKTVLQLMMEGWMDYISTLMLNGGQCQSKAQAWTLIQQKLDMDSRGPTNNDLLGSCWSWTDGNERGSEQGEVYDNMRVKLETWRRALDLVFLVLQTDTEIITGIDAGETCYHGLLCL